MTAPGVVSARSMRMYIPLLGVCPHTGGPSGRMTLTVKSPHGVGNPHQFWSLARVERVKKVPEVPGLEKFQRQAAFVGRQQAGLSGGQLSVKQPDGLLAVPPLHSSDKVASVPVLVHLHTLLPSQNTVAGVQIASPFPGGPAGP